MKNILIILSTILFLSAGAATVSAQTSASSVSGAIVCLQAAVTTRDNVIIAAAGNYNTAWQAALNARISALNTAWSITAKNTRRKALSEAWNQYGKDIRAAKAAYKKTQLAAWDKFYTDRRACSLLGGAADDRTTAGVDNQ